MAISDSELFLSENNLNPKECNFMSRPLLKFQKASQPFKQEKQEEKEGEIDKYKDFVSALEIKLMPSLGEFKVEEGNNNGCRTPRSLKQKIQAVICPPAPRKYKSLPSTKRKAEQRILLDLSSEIESLFPPTLLGDLGNKIKKVRTTN